MTTTPNPDPYRNEDLPNNVYPGEPAPYPVDPTVTQPDLISSVPTNQNEPAHYATQGYQTETYVTSYETQPKDSKQDQAKDEASQVAGAAKNEASQVADTAKNEAGQVAATVKNEGSNVKDVAVSAGGNVVDTAKDELQQVTAHAQDQLRGLVASARSEAESRAVDTHVFVAENVRNLSTELSAINRGEHTSGPVSQALNELAQRGDKLSAWLDRSNPDDIVREVRRFAARRPVAFLAVAAGAGLLVGRIARGAQALNSEDDQRHVVVQQRPVVTQGYRYEAAPVTHAPIDTPAPMGQQFGYGDAQPLDYGTRGTDNTGFGGYDNAGVQTDPIRSDLGRGEIR